MKAFLTGLGIGVGLAVLFAPENGESTRGKVRERIGEWSDTLFEQIDRTKDAIAKQADRFSAGGSHGQEEQRENRSVKKMPRRESHRSNGDLINTISKEELLSVHGIGPVLADRIISGRPYASRQELIERRVLSQNTFEELERELGRRTRKTA
ncbi:MAG: Helix-hairpin-helix motif [Acidobacteriaceae bacterium]|nr:Helix-hairpin-helix motif [Acidobacteriaceae bacterium]